MLYAIKIFDAPASGPLKNQYRPAHLDYVAELKDKMLFAGPIFSKNLMTEIGSHRILEMPNRSAVESYVANDPYVMNSAQHSPEIYHWSPSVPFTWRNCPRKKGNVQYLIHAIDKPNSSALRDKLRLEHEIYQASVENMYITRGPLLNEDNNHQVGSLMIIDVSDLVTAILFMENEPFIKGNLFSSIEFYGWRFGKIFDQFKL